MVEIIGIHVGDMPQVSVYPKNMYDLAQTTSHVFIGTVLLMLVYPVRLLLACLLA